jgi:hypothetical protein
MYKFNRIRHKNILIAKEFFKIDDHLAIIRIDDNPDNIYDGIDTVKQCYNSNVNLRDYDGIVFIPKTRFNTVSSMNREEASNILNTFVNHLGRTISKLKNYRS